MPFPDLIRAGSDQGLLAGDWPAWRAYREMRGKTSHTYDARTALQVVDGIPGFLEEVRFLCRQLQQRAGDA